MEWDTVVPRRRGGLIRRLVSLAVLVAVGYWLVSYDGPPPKRPGLGGRSSRPTTALTSGKKKAEATGPYSPSWNEGERRSYGITADIRSVGNERFEGATGLNLRLNADFDVENSWVRDNGEANLVLTFGDVYLQGNYFGGPLDVRREEGFTNVHASPMSGEEGAGPAFTASDFSFLDTPIDLTFSPSGRLTGVEGAEGASKMFMLVLFLSSPNFPQGDLDTGDQWETKYELSLPGTPVRVPTRVMSALGEREEYSGRNCVRVLHDVTTDKQSRSFAFFDGFLGDKLGGSIPQFKVYGDAMNYYDMDERQLVYTRAELIFELELGEAVQAIADMAQAYDGLLGEMEGGESFDMKATKGKKDKELGIIVNAEMGEK